MGDVSKHFSRSEFKCKCGACDFSAVDIELVKVLEDIREHFGAPIKINSACRCPDHNANVGGAKRSKHLYGIAADIVVAGVEPSDVYQYINDRWTGKYGVLEYRTFVHIDMRSHPYRRPRA